MKKNVIVTASGKGLRMGSDIPKQFLEISGKPILMYTIEQFYNYDNSINIILTLNSDTIEFWNDLSAKHNFTIKHKIVSGGETRFQSIKNAVSEIEANTITAIHDGVRPLVDIDTINNCFNTAKEKGNAVPFIKINESIREFSGTKNKQVNRDNFVLIQTPQVFKSDLLINAYKQEFSDEFTDDASVVEQTGIEINLIEGNSENIKITKPQDLLIAEALLRK